MRLFSSLKTLVELMKPWEGAWAVCGGIAACLYRETPRFTADIDIALIDMPTGTALSIAEAVASGLGYEPVRGFVTDQHGKLLPQTALILGRESKQGSYVGIDFLLPVLPWIPRAVERAQHNKLDFGFARLPTITAEDLIIAKLFAFQGSPERRNDLDDVRSILLNFKNLDHNYIEENLRANSVQIPASLELSFKVPSASPSKKPL